jgi:hypothetical protein
MKAAGLESPDISILSDEFLAEVRETLTVDWMHRDSARANIR